MILSNDGFDAFHYRSYGTFFLHKIGSIISIGDLPTTNIIEPFWIVDYAYDSLKELIDLVPFFVFWFKFKTISIFKLKQFHERKNEFI